MSDKCKVAAGQLVVGYRFPAASYRLEPETIATYLEAIGVSGSRYDDKLVPPTAIAAYALAALSDSMSLPSGTIHTHQELEFKSAVAVGETITCYARVSRNQERGKFHFLSIDLDVLDREQRPVLTGKTSFILP